MSNEDSFWHPSFEVPTSIVPSGLGSLRGGDAGCWPKFSLQRVNSYTQIRSFTMQRPHRGNSELHFTLAFRHAVHDFLRTGSLSPNFLRQYSTWRFRDGTRRLSAVDLHGILYKVRIKQGTLTLCERLEADLAEERSVLLAGISSGDLGG